MRFRGSHGDMTSGRTLYERWVNELWSGKPIAEELLTDDFVGHWPDRAVHGPSELQAIIDETRTMFDELTFVIEIGPIVEGDMVAGRWMGTGRNDEVPVRFFGNDTLRVSEGRFAEYWTRTSTG